MGKICTYKSYYEISTELHVLLGQIKGQLYNNCVEKDCMYKIITERMVDSNLFFEGLCVYSSVAHFLKSNYKDDTAKTDIICILETLLQNNLVVDEEFLKGVQRCISYFDVGYYIDLDKYG
jgi:hypothetical protein